MANVDLSKVMNLADGFEIYKDLRDRLLAKYEKPSTGIPASDLAAGVIPTVPVTDVQVNSTSILQNGIANVPVATYDHLGAVKISGSYGLRVFSSGEISVVTAGNTQLKLGTETYCPITPSNQHKSAFYGISKLAGVDLEDATVTVGTYPDSSKQAIQKLFGLDGILGDFESTAVASKAYAIGETFIYNGKRYKATAAIAISDVIAPGTNCELDPLDGHYVKDTDYASTNKAGVFKMGSGLTMQAGGVLAIGAAGNITIKDGTSWYFPIVPATLPNAIYYGLSKLAGVDLKLTPVTIGTYSDESKAAIQSMLGIEADIPLVETVTGATASITGMPNVRYICDTAISELTITPPASGSIVVRFTAGSNCIVSLPQTVKLPVWFDISSLEAGTTYEIIITDGVYGGVMSWAA